MGEEMNSTSQTERSVVAFKPGVSWGEWLREHGAKLLLFARQQTRSHADAEDILQEGLVKLAKKVKDGTFEGGQSSWPSYVYTSIRRSAIDLGRKNDRRSIREEKVEADKKLQSGGMSDPWFESLSERAESRELIEKALKELPGKFSEVIVLKIWSEQTFAEIGQQLEISQNTAASRYRYGLEALRKLLANARKDEDL